ncbi:MAG: tRNA uridine-5-carboxymethylaminomethyl(34) synthesis GTPase MnmE [Gammaproteobacteria bacterium]
MHDPATDTIAALATPQGRGGIGVVRISGAAAPAIGERMLDALPTPRHAAFGAFYDQHREPLDRGIALYFPSPNSYTGEAVLELQAHGGPMVLAALLETALANGARLAEPGEFTRRAYLNGKMDLTQAEAVVDLINSSTRTAARAAARSLQGVFSADVNALVAALNALRVHVEAAIDFPEEEVDFLSDPQIDERLTDVTKRLARLRRNASQGRRLRDGLTIVIVGRPNAGKSSLLNRLAGHDAAIVTDRPGTTRDVLREDIELDGMPLRIVDTAGLRDSDDPVEVEGVRRARDAMAHADLMLHVIDATEAVTDALALPDIPLITVYNKTDLSPTRTFELNDDVVALSALTGAGVDTLTERLKHHAGFDAGTEGNVIARRRHLDALARAATHIERGTFELKQHAAGEIMAEELRLAQQCLGEITGRVTSDALLGDIFSNFCIGK